MFTASKSLPIKKEECFRTYISPEQAEGDVQDDGDGDTD